MEFTSKQREAFMKSLQDVRAAQTKFENASKDLNEKLGKLKTVAGVTGENFTKVIEAAWVVMGQETERLGWADKE